MTAAARAGRSAPRYATDITADDAWAICDFVMPRMEALERLHCSGSEEHRTAGALAEAVSGLVLRLEAEISRSGRRPSVAPGWTPERVRTEEQRRLGRVQEYWNDVCALVRIWQGAEGHDEVRWQRVSFLDPAGEAEYDRLRAEHGIGRREFDPMSTEIRRVGTGADVKVAAPSPAPSGSSSRV
ncbi:hypothetical protein ACFV7Q_23330 [Streptomyces sp. NPDC059851]|uniref:hypothetical protein n=1 Tax=Streptomyces sp. NPDC059851 TaxID=3346971 RepID=UPI00365B6953